MSPSFTIVYLSLVCVTNMALTLSVQWTFYNFIYLILTAYQHCVLFKTYLHSKNNFEWINNLLKITRVFHIQVLLFNPYLGIFACWKSNVALRFLIPSRYSSYQPHIRFLQNIYIFLNGKMCRICYPIHLFSSLMPSLNIPIPEF